MTIRLPQSAVFAYGLSILTVGIALLITTLFDPPGRTPAYFLAIVGLTWFYGREVGLFTLAVAAVTAAYFTFDPFRSFNLESRDAVQLTTFVIVALATLLLIDALKRRSEALAKSEARYRTLFEYAPEGILIADEVYVGDVNLTEANVSFALVLQWSLPSVVRRR